MKKLTQLRHRSVAVVLVLAGLTHILTARATAAPGDFDETFGPGGYAQFSTQTYLYSGLYSTPAIWGLVVKSTVLAVQSDGKILVAAATDANSPRMMVRRYNVNGTEDLSFGLSGEAVANIFPTTEFVYGVPRDIKVQSDGKILVAGSVFVSGERRFRVWRFASNGILDTDFGNDGIVKKFDNVDADACALALLSGNILVAASNNTISCLTSTGGTCSSFGVVGYISTPVRAITALPRSGKFLTANFTSEGVRRYHANGSLDTSFGNSGTAPICSQGTEVTGIEVHSSGKILVGINLFYYQTDTYTYTLGRLNSSGTTDHTFGTNGCLYSGDPVTPGILGKLQSFRVQLDGKIVVLEGDANDYVSETNYQLVRYDASGTTDSAFIPVGTLPRNQDMLIQPGDGKILTVGNDVLFAQNLWRYRNFYLARYLP